MPTPLKLDGLLAKVETVYGTDAAPTTSADGVRIVQRLHPQISFEYAFLNRRDEAASGSLLPLGPTARNGRLATVDIAVELNGAGTAYSESILPPVDPILRACGLVSSVVTTADSESVSYAPADTNHESATLWCYSGGFLFKLVGCRGNLVWPITAGGYGQVRAVLQGVIESDPSAVTLPAITYPSAVPPVAANMTFTLGGWTPDVVSAEFDLQADVQRIDSAAATEAVAEFAIAGFAPRFTLNAPAVPLSEFDPYDKSKDASALTLAQNLGSTQYNRVKLTSDKVYLEAPAHQDLNGFAQWSLEAQVSDLSITFD